METQPPVPEHNVSSNKSPSRHYALQVRAFLEAAEDVEIDSETIEDILDGFDDVEVTVEVQNESDQGYDGVDDQDDLEVLEGLFEDEEYNEFSREAENAWTEQERKQIIYYLKERGTPAFLKEYVTVRSIPVPRLLHAFGVCLCPELQRKRDKTLLYFLQVVIYQVLQQRKKISSLNTIDDAINLIQNSKQILILSGAGISVSCGIPDFRSRDGLYASLKDRGEHDLDDPQQMFDIQYFREKPSVFYTFAREIYPSNFTPSPCHRFIKLIEDKDKLLRNYTQNIDTLETQAGVKRVLQCHGSFATATCVNCRQKVKGTDIEDDILNCRVALCRVCNVVQKAEDRRPIKKKKTSSGWRSDESESDESDEPDHPPGIMKPDITFFGEKLGDEFENALLGDREIVDLIIVIGTSLKVSPVSEIITHVPHSVPQILINKTPIKHINPDIILLGNADDIILHLCHGLGWELPLTESRPPLVNLGKRRPSISREPERVAGSHVWLFEGAEGGKWLQTLRAAQDDSHGAELRDSSDARDPKKIRVV